MEQTQKTVGVVVGRFQVARLHKGHTHLLNYAMHRNDALLVVLGTSPGLPTPTNPLSFEMRKAMLRKEFPTALIEAHGDHPSNESWSAGIDALIEQKFPEHQVTLYGSRDSFLPHYRGRHKTEEVPKVECASGTHHRNKTGARTLSSEAFRRGVVHAHATRLPIAYPTVDIAIIRPEHREVLLGEKRIDGGKFRFIGGFFDPTQDKTLEQAARREAYEETRGMNAEGFRYLASMKVDDWRYRNTTDSIVTTFFMATYVFAGMGPGDDIDALHWVPYEDVMGNLIETHQPLGQILLDTLTNKGENHEHHYDN